ncbi:MAG: Smr/MutS family protein [Bacteroidota bacterium]
MLHESGEGVITQLLDKFHVEVDMGDEFPIDVHVKELIPIDRDEKRFLGQKEEEEVVQERRQQNIQVLGTQILDLSLAVISDEESDLLDVYIINPEPTDALITCFARKGKRFEGWAAGEINSGTYLRVGRVSRAEINQLRSFYIQVLQFVPGKGHPHTPMQRELGWNKGRLQNRPSYITAFQKDGWAFSLREDEQQKEITSIPESEFVKVKKAQNPVERKDGEVDLHIEELVARPHLLAPSEMLQIQLEHLSKAIDTAIREEYASLVVIHGVGTGALKKAVQDQLKQLSQVAHIEQGDVKKYGNGATKAVFH